MKRILYLLLLGGLICSQVSHALPYPLPWLGSLGYFNAIHVEGDWAIHLVSTQEAPHYSFDTQDPSHLEAFIENQTLYLKLPPHHAPVWAQIYIRNLRSLNVHGNTQVWGNHLNFTALEINADDFAALHLTGILGLKCIRASGNSTVHLHWVNSKVLNITTLDQARVDLAGVAQQVYATALHSSQLDARYLRTHEFLARTADDAEISALPIQSLYAHSHDNSQVYAYKSPRHLTSVSTESANILPLENRT
jgi:hypothetical protein